MPFPNHDSYVAGGRRAGRGPLVLDDDDDDVSEVNHRQPAQAAAARPAGRRRAPGFFASSGTQGQGGTSQRVGRFGTMK